MTTTNQRAVEELAMFDAVIGPAILASIERGADELFVRRIWDDVRCAMLKSATRTPGWRPISEDLGWPEGVAFIAEVMPDWTSMQLRDGSCYAFNRATGKVYKVPHPECPFVIVPNLPPLPPPPGEG